MSVADPDPIIHQANRLRVITVLFRNRELAVTTIRNELEMTDGNLASHLERLQAAGYVKTGRVLAGLTFEVHAKITPAGAQAYLAYLSHLRSLLQLDAGREAPVPGAEAGPANANPTGT